MHWSGKLFVWMALIAWIAALPLVTKLMKIRAEYHQQLTTLRSTNETNAEKLVALKQKQSELQDRFATVTRGWGQTFIDRAVGLNVNEQTGEMDIGLGTDDGLGLPDPTKRPIVIHGFRPLDDDQYEYMGPYTVKQPGAINSTVEPRWKLLDDGVRGFELKPGVLLRWREYVPTTATVDLTSYVKQLVYNGELLEKRKRDLTREEEALAKHNEQLATRMAELVGVPGGETGLLDKVVTAEEARNAELAAVDDLRRRIADAHAKQQRLKASVADLESKLPGAVAEADTAN